jgi:hypothetical protein
MRGFTNTWLFELPWGSTVLLSFNQTFRVSHSEISLNLQLDMFCSFFRPNRLRTLCIVLSIVLLSRELVPFLFLLVWGKMEVSTEAWKFLQ